MDIVCSHEGRRCSAVVGDCLCDCANCDERRVIAVLDSDTRYDHVRDQEMPEDEGDSYPESDHPCPKDEFLNDPITVHYGAQELVDTISCKICDARDAD